MNNDLISRKALIEAYDKAHQGPPGGARKLMEEAPGVDAVVLPCKVGQTVYYLFQYSNKRILPFVRKAKVEKIYCGNSKMRFLVECEMKDTKEKGIIKTWHFDDFGKTIFLSREEAEEALAMMEGRKEK